MTQAFTQEQLEKGEVLPVMEAFYTLQGEGYHSGTAAFFLRIGGCDVGCHWCDVKESWNPKLFPPQTVDSIIANLADCPARTLVVTGGEPLMYNLDILCDRLLEMGFQSHLETSGSYPLSGKWNWICLSPKMGKPPLSSVYVRAHELKVIIETEKDFEWAELNAAKVNSKCHLFLQPEWSRSKVMMPVIIDYIMKHPHWSISLQSHKYMNIP